MRPLRLAVLCTACVGLLASGSAAQVTFTDVTAAAGVGTRSYEGSGLASGSAWGDYNGDGFADLFVGNHYDMPVLYKNLCNGRFANVTTQVMVKPANIVNGAWGDQHGAAWADFDKDGDQDLLVLVGGQEGQGLGPNQLYENHGGRLADCARMLAVDYPLGRGRTPTWLDYDNDGRLDLFEGAVARPDRLAPPTLFRDLTTSFVDVREATNFKPLNTLGIWLSDLNRDGRMEVLFQGTRTAPPAARASAFSIIQTATATATAFRDVTPVAFRSSFPDIVAADVNGDLRPDLFVCNSWSNPQQPFGHELYLNLPAGFVRRSDGSGINGSGRPCRPSAIAADFDNDMDVDLYFDASAGDSIGRTGGDLANVMLWNNGDGTFVADASAGGAVGRLAGWGDSAAAADFDRDGFIDIYLTYDAAVSQLYRNGGGNGNHWLAIDLVGRSSNADGVGAQVLVTAGGITQLREQTGGIHRLWSQNHQRIHVGLGANTVASRVVVQWPSGRKSVLANVAADRVRRIVEPR